MISARAVSCAHEAGSSSGLSASGTRIEAFRDLTSAEPVWRQLEAEGALQTPYQRFDWIAPWQHHVGSKEAITPFVVVGRDEGGSPLFLWPFGILRKGPLRLAQYLGGKHANFNFPLWQPRAAASISAAELRRTLDQVAADRIDLLALTNQPEHWDGVTNPFLLLAHQPSPSNGYRAQLGGPGPEVIARLLSSTMRGRLRNKQRKLEKLAGYGHARATTAADVDRYLDAFFVQKSTRFAEQRLENVFAEPGVEAFVRAACHAGLADGRSLIEVHALEGGGEVLAVFAGVTDGRRFSSMFNSYTLGEHARWSPGLILLVHIISDLADRGIEMFDLGVGEAHYKSFFCEDEEALFDSFIPFTALGRLAAATAKSAYGMKRRIKRSPALWSALQTVRRQFGPRSRSA